MALPNIFDKAITNTIVQRINNLNPTSKALWGTMDAAQMLAHCNVTYEMAYENIHPSPNFFLKFILKSFVKKTVVNEVPFKKNLQTSPAFIIKSEKDFENEKQRLMAYLQKTVELGRAYFNNKESNSFGVLNEEEWNNMFYKHITHHLDQFGV